MNPDLLNEINSLVLEYKTKRNRDILEKIQRKLIHLEFQSDVLRSNLGIIENPELKYFDYEFKKYHSKFSYSNALSKYHIIIPLLMYLLQNHATDMPAYETSLKLMEASIDYLREGDYAKLKTGGQRFITNTRFAADILRQYGLLRSDKRVFFKVWELSPYGLVVACNLYLDGYKYFSSEYFKQPTAGQAETFTLKLLNQYAKRSDALENLKSLVEYTRQEEELILLDQNMLFNYLSKFNVLLDSVIKDGRLNKNKTSTKDLIRFMEKNNLDVTFSLFADGLRLRNDIEVNIKDIYKILRS